MNSPLHHLVITVSDLACSKSFYSTVLTPLGWSVRGEGKDFVEFVPPGDPQGVDFLLVLGLARDLPKAAPFNRNNVGLDHYAFSIKKDQVQPLLISLKNAQIVPEDGGLTSDDFGGEGIFLTDPDGMKVEFHLSAV
jgi:catechol 2,3-dioxygenase-like lactoylglutathione lyase family enzyme